MLMTGATVFAVGSPAFAQTIEQGTLEAPTAFDAGVIDIRTGGLDPNLWQGTSASLATGLIEAAPLQTSDPLIKDMLRAVLLSSGIPPQGDTIDLRRYEAAKLAAVSEISDEAALETLVARTGSAARMPLLQAELALRTGDITTACGLSDTITEGRSKVFWKRLRTLCHLEREEFAAAELTTDLLRSSGFENPAYFALVRVLSGASKTLPAVNTVKDPISRALYNMAAVQLDAARPGQAFDPAADPDLRLAALFKFAWDLSDAQITQVFSDLAFDPDDIEGSSSFDLASVEADLSARGTAKLFLLAKATGDADSAAKAFALLLRRAPDVPSRQRLMALMDESIQNWPASVQAQSDLGLYARAAVQRGDILTLQGLFAALPEGEEQARIALAADALGNGFLLGQIGRDIDSRLEASENARAKRDALLALALGAQLSEAAANALAGSGFSDGRKLSEGDKAILKANAQSRHSAQLLLRLAPLLEGSKLSASDLAFVVECLRIAGVSQFAGRLAARDFLDPL
jgi:hypothetical protein